MPEQALSCLWSYLLELFQCKKLAERMAFQKSFLVEYKRLTRLLMPMNRGEVIGAEGQQHVTKIVALFEELRTGKRGCEGSGVCETQRVDITGRSSRLKEEIQPIGGVRLAHHNVN